MRWRCVWIAASVVITVFACADLDGLNAPPPEPNDGGVDGTLADGATLDQPFTVSVSVANDVVQGKDLPFDVRVERRAGFNELINITLSSLPAGVIAQPPLLVLPAGASSATGKLTTTLETPQGSHTIAVAASAGGGLASAATTFAIVVRGTPGSIDVSFGSGGKLVLATGTSIEHALFEPDGHFVACGQSPGGAGVMVYRFRADGTLEPGFADGGTSAYVAGTFTYCSGLVVNEGKIYAAAYDRFRVLSFDGVTGALDPGFGDGGVFELGGTATVHALHLRNNLLFAGGVDSTQLRVVRLSRDGTLDTRFGDGGVMPPPTGFATSIVNAFDDSSDDSLIVAGAVANSSPSLLFVGRVTTGVAGTGTLVAPEAGVSVTSIENLPDAGLFVSGTASYLNGTAYRAFIAKYRDRGLPLRDQSFGSAGVALLPNGASSFGADLIVDTTTLTICGGLRGETLGTPADVFVARYLVSGAIDPTFGNAGVTTIDFAGNDGATTCLFTPDGKRILVIGGSTGRILMTQLWR